MPPTPQATRPFGYVTGDAARYTLMPFRQDRAKHAGRKIPTDKPGKSRNEIFSACNVIMYEQYVILYYIVGPTCRGPNGQVHAYFEIKKRDARCTGGQALWSTSSPNRKRYGSQGT